MMKLSTLNGRIAALGALAAVIVLTLPTMACAQRGAGGGARGGGMFNSPGMRMWTLVDEDLEEFTKQLTLTETQTESLNTLLTDFREKNKDGLARYTEMRQNMPGRGGAGGGAGNRQAMQGLMQQMRSVLETLNPAFEKLHANFGEVLDEDQTKKLAELLQPRRPGG